MDSNLLFNVALLANLVAGVSFMIRVARPRKQAGWFAEGAMAVGWLLTTGALIARGLAAGHVPLANTYETLMFLAWLVPICYLCVRKQDSQYLIATGTAFLTILVIACSSLVSDVPRPLVPALRSNWLTIHVLFMFISYSAFSISFITALLYLILGDRKSTAFERITYQLIVVGFPFLTLGIFTGAVWANRAWGTYWSWDPKETWSLITWLIYAIYLHIRRVRGWAGAKSAWIVMLAFAIVLFTYFGVNYLLTGLHSYK
ncbi:MAG: cytochrome c biogenesis protein CcsA [Candidatus Margulisiibacteriota bacterium]